MKLSKLGEFRRYQTTLPKELAEHPSMMSDTERSLIYGIARDWYSGRGLIVDAGIFLGASTRLFRHGIASNEKRDEIISKYAKPVASYEHGILGGGMPAFFERHKINTEGLIEGNSFAPLLRKMIADTEDMVELHFGDIREMDWKKGPIEILFLDILKLYDIQQHIMEKFYPSLIPGRSIIIHQDYFYDHQPFIRTAQEFLSPYFDYIGNAQSSAYFRLKKKIPKKVLKQAIDIETLTTDEKIKLINQSVERISEDPDRAYLVLLSRVRQVLHDRGVEAAREEKDRVDSEFPDQANLQTAFKARIRQAVDTLNTRLRHEQNNEVY